MIKAETIAIPLCTERIHDWRTQSAASHVCTRCGVQRVTRYRAADEASLAWAAALLEADARWKREISLWRGAPTVDIADAERTYAERVLAFADAADRRVAAAKFDGQRVTVASIQLVVAAYFSLEVADLKGKRRHLDISTPRMIAMYLSRQLTDASFPEIGRHFGGKDHTTVMHACKRIESLQAEDEGLRHAVESLRRRLWQVGPLLADTELAAPIAAADPRYQKPPMRLAGVLAAAAEAEVRVDAWPERKKDLATEPASPAILAVGSIRSGVRTGYTVIADHRARYSLDAGTLCLQLGHEASRDAGLCVADPSPTQCELLDRLVASARARAAQLKAGRVELFASRRECSPWLAVGVDL